MGYDLAIIAVMLILAAIGAITVIRFCVLKIWRFIQWSREDWP